MTAAHSTRWGTAPINQPMAPNACVILPECFKKAALSSGFA
jgi:hypothetical protein